MTDERNEPARLVIPENDKRWLHAERAIADTWRHMTPREIVHIVARELGVEKGP